MPNGQDEPSLPNKPRSKDCYYCYVDVSGQDTNGQLFIVSVVITPQVVHRSLLLNLGTIEEITGKGHYTWAKSKDDWRIRYMWRFLRDVNFKGYSYYGVYRNLLSYSSGTAQITAQALQFISNPCRINVVVDGLTYTEYQQYIAILRRYNSNIGKIKFIKNKTNALVRLADSLCGFIRDTLGGKRMAQELFRRLVNEGYLIELKIGSE